MLALLPPLATHVLEAIDVERLTHEIKMLSASGSGPLLNVPIPVMDDDARSDAGSSVTGETAQSWVDQFNLAQSTLAVEQHDVSASAVQLDMPPPPGGDSPRSTTGATETSMSSSMLSETSSVSSSSAGIRSKAELWRDVKISTFARSLTIAYSTTLLTLFTHFQLSLLGRHKYVASVRALNRENARQERGVFDASLLFDFGFSRQQHHEGGAMGNDEDEEDLTEDIERRYLTLSWWLLNEGWQVLSSRVRAAVEEVFDAVSLKTQLSIDDLALLVRAVRTHIDASDNFIPVLIPPASADLARVVGGSATFSSTPSAEETLLHALLDETRSRLASADFALVVRGALEAGEAALLGSLERSLFQPDAQAAGDADLEASFGPRVRALPTKRVRLASLLPGVARWAHSAHSEYPNGLVDTVAGLREVEVFCAIVYSAYDDDDVAGPYR